MEPPASNLDELRRRLDAIDERIHDLIVDRAGVVEHIGALKQTTGYPSFRPGRVAEILRRRIAHHRGSYPVQSLVRLWYELLGGAVAMQGQFPVAVAVPDAKPGLWDMARDYFGSFVPMTAMRAPAEVLSAVGDGRAAVGVLPLPVDNEAAPWWPALAGTRGQGPQVIARLPFAGIGNGRDSGDALVIGPIRADATEADRTMLVVETRQDLSRARLIGALEGIGSRVSYLAAHTPAAGECWHLIELDGSIAAQDPRVAAAHRALAEPIPEAWLFGSYARPMPRGDK